MFVSARDKEDSRKNTTNIHVSTGIKIVEFCLDLRKLEIDELGTNQ